MKLELEDIQRRVDRTEDEQRDLFKMMDAWEAMWNLDAGFKKTWRESVLQDGVEQVTTPDPYNAVLLAMRLIPSEPKIDVPQRDETVEAKEDAEQVERFLTAMYPRINYQQDANFIEEHKWQLFALGNSPIQILWIKDKLPKQLQKKQLPFMIRTLDPRNVGVKRGPLYTEWAYHKYEAEKVDVRQEYPDLKKWDEPKPVKATDNEDNLVTVTDFWYRSGGDVWHAILVENEFALNPVKTDYPVIPIIYAKGDHGGMSLLHAMEGLWQYKCRLSSNLGTSVLWYTHPFFAIETPMGQEMGDWQVKPLATVHVPEGTKVQTVTPQPNTGLIESMLAKVDASLQQSAFPQVLYGDAGNMQAGYGVNILSQAATGRVQAVREAMERSLMQLNELVLMLIDTFDDDDEGVELWGRDPGSEKLYKTCLYKAQIGGYYENDVQLTVSTPQDDIALQTLGIRLADGKYISKQTFRDKYLKITVPGDEESRIMAEMALENPEVQKVLSVVHLIEAYPITWESITYGTPLHSIAVGIIKNNERIAQKVAMGEIMPPMLMEPPQAPPQGPPPGPPMGGPPPGMMPPPGPPPPMQPPPVINGPMGGGFPPEMQGGFGGGEAMGMDPQMDPALFAQIMGAGLPPGEELDQMANQNQGTML